MCGLCLYCVYVFVRAHIYVSVCVSVYVRVYVCVSVSEGVCLTVFLHCIIFIFALLLLLVRLSSNYDFD